MKKYIPYTWIILILLSGCTQIVTVPIDITASVVSGTIDIAGSAVDAVIPDGDEDKEN